MVTTFLQWQRTARREWRQAVTAATHVLQWLPGWTVDDGEGFWELQTFEAFIAGTPVDTYDGGCFPRDAGQFTLAGWATAQLGFPVVLTAGEVVISSVERPRWRERCPFYWVTPLHLLAPGERSP